VRDGDRDARGFGGVGERQGRRLAVEHGARELLRLRLEGFVEAIEEIRRAFVALAALVEQVHAVVPYGYESYYLNVMAGPKRAWHFNNDPAHPWIIERDR
jgi:hypothetical protein